MKYTSWYPKRSSCMEHARTFCVEFNADYDNLRYHSGLAMLTPVMVHHDRAQEIIAQRQVVLTNAFAKHPEGFVHGARLHTQLPTKVWINKS